MVEVMQQVISVIVNDVLAPAVARTGDLDGVVQSVKFSVASYMQEAGLAPDILAKHFGKSERSIYRYFEQMGRDVKKGEANHEGVQLMNRILDFFYARKEPLPSEACIRFLRRQDPSVSPSDIQGLLDLYATMGHLKRITEEEGGNRIVRYQAPEQAAFHQAVPGSVETMRLLSRKLRALLPMVLAYARQEEGASMMLVRGRVLRHHMVEAMRDINEFTKQRWMEARVATDRDDPDGQGDIVDACALVMGGPGALDDLEIDRGAGHVYNPRGQRAQAL